MWSNFGIPFLVAANKVATPEWVIDRLHAYTEFFQKTFIFNEILRVIGINLIMIFYAIDTLFAKIIFLILGMSTAADASKTGADFNGSILGLLGDGNFQTLVKVGMGLGVSVLGAVGIWLYIKMLMGRPVALGEIFTNLFTTAIIFIATPALLIISLRGGAYVFGSLSMRQFSVNPQTQEVSLTNKKVDLGDDFVWGFVGNDIVATGDAVTGQYLLNESGKRIANTEWSNKTVQDDAKKAADYNDVVAGNFPIEGRKQNIGSVASGKDIGNFRNSFAGQRDVITSSVGSWNMELMKRIPLPSDVQRKKDGNWWDKLVAAWEKKIEGSDRASTWGLLSGYSYDYDTYNIQEKNQSAGSGSHLIPVSQGDILPFSSGHYYYYSINWSVIITLLALFFLLFDIFYKLLIAFLDICATLLIGWGGMTATAESGRGNAVFIEEMLNYGKVCLVSGMSLGLFVVVTDFLKNMFATLKTNGALNGIETMIASPIVLLVVTFAFLNGSGAFIKFVGVDAGFGYGGGLFAALGAKALGKSAGKAKEAAGNAMKKGVNALSGDKSQESVERHAAKDEARNYRKAGKIIKAANNGKMDEETRDQRLDELSNTIKGGRPLRQFGDRIDKAIAAETEDAPIRKVLKDRTNDQDLAHQRLGVLRSKIDSGIATEEENEYKAMNLARSGNSSRNLAQKVVGVDSRDLSQFDNQGQRKGAVDIARMNMYKERIGQMSSPDSSGDEPWYGTENLREMPKTNINSAMEAVKAASGSGTQTTQRVELPGDDTRIQTTRKAGTVNVEHSDESLYNSIPQDLEQSQNNPIETFSKDAGTQQVTQRIQGKDIEVTRQMEQGKIVRENTHQSGSSEPIAPPSQAAARNIPTNLDNNQQLSPRYETSATPVSHSNPSLSQTPQKPKRRRNR